MIANTVHILTGSKHQKKAQDFLIHPYTQQDLVYNPRGQGQANLTALCRFN